jgi:hypothetical protein
MVKQAKLPEPVHDRAMELKEEEEFSSIGDAIRHVFTEAGYDV